MSGTASAAAMANPNLDLGTSLNSQPAPEISLTNQFGQPMSLSQFRGKVVMLGFEDSECTTVCPLTTQSMVLAKELLGKAGNNGPAPRRGRQPGRHQRRRRARLLPRARHGQPVGLPHRVGRPAQGGLERLPHRGADRAGPDRPHARAVRHRLPGQAAEALPDPDGVLERLPVRPGAGHRDRRAAARPPEAVQPGVARRPSTRRRPRPPCRCPPHARPSRGPGRRR